MAFNRSNFTASKLETARKDSAEGKTNYGGSTAGHTWYKLINGLQYFKKPKEPGKLVVNILPFMHKDGTTDWVYNKFVHKIPKSDGSRGTNDYICTHNDPICYRKNDIENEAKANGLERANWEDIKPYVAKSYSLYLMNPVGTDDVFVFECPTKISATIQSFPEILRNQAVACAGDDSIVDYASLDEGKSVVLVYSMKEYNGHKYTDITGVAFADRREEISDVVLNKIPDYIEMLDNISPNDEKEMSALINGEFVDTSSETSSETEEKKQEKFEDFIVNGNKPEAESEPILSDDDFKRDPYTKPEPAKMDSDVSCPNGFDPISEYGTHRQCMRCPHADKCEKIAG